MVQLYNKNILELPVSFPASWAQAMTESTLWAVSSEATLPLTTELSKPRVLMSVLTPEKMAVAVDEESGVWASTL